MNFLDSMIGAVSPSWQAQRLAARVSVRQLEKLSTYSDANITRIDPTSYAPGTDANWNLELGRDRRQMCDRVRQLMRDNVIARALSEKTAEAVCGTGYRLQMRALKSNGELDESYNHLVEDLFEEWAEKGPGKADFQELCTLHELNTLQFRGYQEDGESGFVKVKNGQLKGFESADLGDPAGYFRPGAVDGLILDDEGRPKTFKLFKPDMYTIWADRRVAGDRAEIPASDVIYQARRTRLRQVRGETAFMGGFVPLEQLVRSVEAVTVSLRMGACLGLVVTTANAFQLPAEPDNVNQQRRTLKLSPGGVINLKPGEGVTPIVPSALTPNIQAHLDLLCRMAGSAWGQPVELVLNNFGAMNLSSARANVLTAVRTWKPLQFKHAITYTAQLDWRLLKWIEDGEVPEPKNGDWRNARRHRWIKPRALLLDPLADAQAQLLELDAGQTTLEEIAEERGYTLEQLKRHLTEQKKILDELELPQSTLTRPRVTTDLMLRQRPPAAEGEKAGRVKAKKRDELTAAKNRIAAALRNSA